jgi:hypothetical protein
MGIPVEESVLQFVPAGAVILTGVAVFARNTLGRVAGRRLSVRGGRAAGD